MDVRVVNGSEGAGALVFWRLAGALDPATMRAAWAAAGFAEAALPKLPSPAVALQRAMQGLTEKRRLSRPLPGGGAHALVDEKASTDSLDYSVALRATLDAVGRVVVTPPDHALADTLRAAYERALNECSTSDVAEWLVAQVRQLDGVSMREGGGFYFLSPAAMAKWDRVSEILETFSGHRLFSIPAMRTPDAVAAVLDALELETAAEAARLHAQVTAGKLGRRALQARAEEVQGMADRVRRYEATLGGKLEALHEQLEQLNGVISMTLLEGEEDA